MVDPVSTLGEVDAVTRIAPEFAPKIVECFFTKIDILMSIILGQIQFSAVLGIIAILYRDKLFVIIYRDKKNPARYRFIGIAILLFQNQR